jgi:hypothetical protein
MWHLDNDQAFFDEVVDLLDVVDGSESFVLQAGKLLDSSSRGGNAYLSLFESFGPTMLLDNVYKKWLVPGGELLLIVQNVFSLHHKLGVKFGLLEDEFSAT